MKSLPNIKRYGVRLLPVCYGILAILVLSCSGLSYTLDQNNMYFAELNSLMKEDFNYEEASKEAYDHLLSQWNPQDTTFCSENISKLKDSIPEDFLDTWFNDFPSVNTDGLENSSTTSSSEHRVVNTKTSYTDGAKTVEQTIFYDKPRIKIIEANLSGIDSIIVPVRSRTADTQILPIESEKIVEEALIGIDINILFDKSIEKKVAIFKFRFWGYFEFRFHFAFPVNLTIEYPREVIQGARHTFNCTLKPIDKPNYNEFEIFLKFDFGTKIQQIFPKLYWKRKSIKIFGKRRTIKVPRFKWVWKTIFGVNLPFKFHLFDSYKTPLGGEKATIHIPGRLNILPYIKHPYVQIISQVLEAGIGFGKIKIYGSRIQGRLGISAGNWNPKLTVTWRTEDETNRLNFTMPETNANIIKFHIDKLQLISDRIDAIPYIFAQLKNFGPIALGDWLGTFKLDVPFFHFLPVKIGSRYHYSTAGLPLLSEDVYDFSMDIKKETTDYEGYEIFSNLFSHDEKYAIKLRNLAGRMDDLELGIMGLPPGYTASFDKALYTIGSDPVTAELTISPPDQITTPPGAWNFSISALSHSKKQLKMDNITAIKRVTLDVPEYVDLDFSLEHNITQIIQIDPGEYIPIEFYGENFGNMNDTFIVNATLRTEESNHTWQRSFTVEQFGSGQDQYFSGKFGFNFEMNDVYPPTGLYSLDIQAASQRAPEIIKKHVLILNFTSAYRVEASISPNQTTIYANWEHNFTLSLNNTGNNCDNFTLVSEGWRGYLTFSNRITNVEPMESEAVIITLRIPDPYVVDPGRYMFRIKAISENSEGTAVFLVDDVYINLLGPDFTPPGIVYIDPFYSTEILMYPQSSLTLGPIWKAFDEHPDVYEVFINGSSYTSDDWVDGMSYQVPVTGVNPLEVGIHNITITFNDTTGKSSNAQTWVTITAPDETEPQLTPIDDYVTLPENFAYQQFITWNCSDDFLYNAVIRRNDSIIPFTDFFIEQEIDETTTWRTKCVIQPNNLTIGVYNFTLTVQDMGDNVVSSSILVNIVVPDNEDPILTELPTSSAIQGRDESLFLTMDDTFPDRYELWINSGLVLNSTWQSGIQITLNADKLNLSIGANNLEFFVYDLAGNTVSHQMTLDFQDVDPPTLLTIPNDFMAFEHNISLIPAPFWLVEDLNPANYSVYRNNSLVNSGSWVFGNNSISVPIGNLTAGNYHFEAIFTDSSGNNRNSSVDVTVVDILAPYIWPIDPIFFEPLYSPSWFELFVTERHPDTYELYKNDSLIEEGFLTVDFPIIFVRIDTFSPGYNFYELVVSDESGNIANEMFSLHVTDFTPPLIKTPPDIVYSEGTIGNTLNWEILEANPQNYSLYRESSLIQSGTLESMMLQISLDGLQLGEYPYTLIVYDEFGLSHSCTSYVTVVDVTEPLVSHISDCRFVVGDLDAKLVWQASELHPESYTLEVNREHLLDRSWNGDEITLQLVGWSQGNYTVKLIVSDTSGNTAIDTVRVELVDEEEVTEIVSRAPGFELLLAFTTCIVLVLKRSYRKRR